MKIKKIILKIITIITVVLSLGFNIYQGAIVKWHREVINYEVHENLVKFAGTAGSDYNDQAIYAQSYAAIDSAFNAYINLSEGRGYSGEDHDNGLPRLLLELQSLLLNDKDKVEAAFKDTDGSELIFKIAEDFYDKESISKVLDLLK